MNYPTWSDLNSPSIVPPFGARSAPQLGSTAVLVSCGPDFRLIRSSIPETSNKTFFNSTLITSIRGDKGAAFVGPYIGAPYAAMLLESVIAQGAHKVIVLGWCGAASPDFEVGDIVIPNRAIVDEGTSQNYARLDPDLPLTLPDQDLTRQLEAALNQKDVPFKTGTVWTTDAIYRETSKKVAYFKNLGADVVEMECSALFAVGRYRQIPVTSLLVVSDSVASKDWEPGFRNKKFKSGRKSACDAATDLAFQLA